MVVEERTTSAPQQPYFIPHIQPLKMELIECSETSAYCNFNQTPGKYPKEYIHKINALKIGQNSKSNKRHKLISFLHEEFKSRRNFGTVCSIQ